MIRRGVIVVLAVVAFVVPAAASAHELKTDNTIGVVLHVNPNDDPIAGESSNFFFDIKDKSNQFDLANCDCYVIVAQQNKELSKQPLLTSSSAVSYTFPSKGIYTVSLQGKPYDAASFTPFAVNYTIRVDKVATVSGVSGNTFSWSPLHIFHLGLILLVAIYVVYRIESARRFESKNKERNAE